ncbi:hypothetical protein DRO91_03625 [Candidatus Heimdallarchaeota archaeon]|nr:MAG: hypothetical protein DRO63_00190 [Candidatus Gerdarchaeota archaeon]RLI69877.1 MAG: hypothetical protein DRP02_09505 [Candidatus Gerdarchaeota archaeon]RLI73110.1 MAG: hypothetical protein DRO91_03625 [Candidatus Heimdallarchaeota archaeon]
MKMTGEKAVIAKELDCMGWECYQINLSLRIEVKTIHPGEILKFVTDNPKADEKIFKWCQTNKQELFLSDFKNGKYYYYIKRLS